MWGDASEINSDNYGIIHSKTVRSESFEHMTRMIGSTRENNNILDIEVVVPLKYLSNFWKSPNLSLINSEIELDLPWLKNSVISEVTRTAYKQ